jgi:hypothetical protein
MQESSGSDIGTMGLPNRRIPAGFVGPAECGFSAWLISGIFCVLPRSQPSQAKDGTAVAVLVR